MEYEEAVESLIKKFTSCSVPQATITREEWEAIHSQLELLNGEMPLSAEDTKSLINAIKNPGPANDALSKLFKDFADQANLVKAPA